MTTQYEYYNTPDNANAGFQNANWEAQTFTVGASDHTIKSIKFKAFRGADVGTVTASIRAVDGSGHPTGSDLTSGTMDGSTITTSSPGAWYEIQLTEYTLTAGTKYAVVFRWVSSVYCAWRVDSNAGYGAGNREVSTNSGSTWITDTSMDHMFEVWGNPASTPISVTDAGSGVEVPKIGLTMPDSGSGSETGISIGPLISDSGVGAEATPTLAAAFTITDPGAGADLLNTISVTLTITDANSAVVENPTLESQIPITDSGAGVDVIALTVSFAIAEVGSGADPIALTAYMYPTDSGGGLETKYGGYTTYLLIYDANIATVETISTPGTLMILDIGLFAEFAWRTKPTSPMIDSLALPHVLAIIISDPASMSDKKVQGGSLPRRKMVGKEGRKVTIEGWTDEQSEIDVLEALMNGATRTFYHPSGDSFAVLVTAFNPSLRVDEFDRRIYSLTLAEK